jgi:hypothetical protein
MSIYQAGYEKLIYQDSSGTMSLFSFINMFWDNAIGDAILLVAATTIGYVVALLLSLASSKKSGDTDVSALVKLKNIFLSILKHVFGIYLSAILVSHFLYTLAWITSDVSYFPWEYMKGKVFQLIGISIFTSLLSIKIINKVSQKIKIPKFKRGARKAKKNKKGAATLMQKAGARLGKIAKYIVKPVDYIRTQLQSKVINKANKKVEERILLSLKAELAREHKNISDYTDEEVKIILSDKREQVIGKIKDKSLIGLLITLIIGI